MIQTLLDSAPNALCATGILLTISLAILYISENIWKQQ